MILSEKIFLIHSESSKKTKMFFTVIIVDQEGTGIKHPTAWDGIERLVGS